MAVVGEGGREGGREGERERERRTDVSGGILLLETTRVFWTNLITSSSITN